jgi:hypothetical protein
MHACTHSQRQITSYNLPKYVSSPESERVEKKITIGPDELGTSIESFSSFYFRSTVSLREIRTFVFFL